MKTALVRNFDGALTAIRNDYYRTNDEMAQDLRGNGYRVINVWDGDKTNEEIDIWMLYHGRY